MTKFLGQKKITNEFLLEFLGDKFLKFVDALISQDEKTIRAMAEKNFADKLFEGLEKIKTSGIQFEPGSGQLDNYITSDKTDYGMLRGNLTSD